MQDHLKNHLRQDGREITRSTLAAVAGPGAECSRVQQQSRCLSNAESPHRSGKSGGRALQLDPELISANYTLDSRC
jgi:hypothetical protein